MKIMIAYATTEGQTKKIARWITDHLVARGITVELTDFANAAPFHAARFDGVVLAGSVHIGHYQKDLTHFVADHAEALNAANTLFLSVSLASAGHDAEDWRGLEKILSDLTAATGWQPGQVAQIAGAYVPSQYDLVRRLIMRRIIAKRDPDIDLDADKEYTDWAELRRVMEHWLERNPISAYR